MQGYWKKHTLGISMMRSISSYLRRANYPKSRAYIKNAMNGKHVLPMSQEDYFPWGPWVLEQADIAASFLTQHPTAV